MARIGMMQALNRHGAKADPAPRRKRAKAEWNAEYFIAATTSPPVIPRLSSD
jgi:hypothetical protein